MAIRKRFIYLLAVLLSSSPSVFAWHNQYDWQIRKAARHYLPVVPWKLYKAQLIQESALNPQAVSPVGAAGLAQFMPGTWHQISQELDLSGKRTDPSLAIPAGAYYMAKLRRVWKWPRPEEDRHNLALACYNAGCGNILKAQKLCGNPSRYKPIMACLPFVTGKYATETINYAPRIRRIYQRLTYQ
ncbi:Membrane-bound lytic murein transglycosylase F precursor [Vibrio aerogenes CECT 7868]|uniref:Membrane-bound lytic murein transglycosylase F n=1 Tax=Vibrio aerogenes CECT 7868 TaxID=1216006 RepID=A0A1M6B7C2_9VIBR|nr:transglycosylase SLT domain-containing protein [Vibrio aerogenes]SHI44622.1 Membrane-bound lytic murein transglycosylase F precursor [Vibrio aerogenes CECT 7868]